MPPEPGEAAEATRRVLHWMLVGTRGGPMRGRILNLLRQEPRNAHRIAQQLGVQYRTVLHHLEVLSRNGLVIPVGSGYGREYCPTQWIVRHPGEFESLFEQIAPRTRTAALPTGGASGP